VKTTREYRGSLTVVICPRSASNIFDTIRHHSERSVTRQSDTTVLTPPARREQSSHRLALFSMQSMRSRIESVITVENGPGAVASRAVEKIIVQYIPSVTL
jgi:hypothetical protein